MKNIQWMCNILEMEYNSERMEIGRIWVKLYVCVVSFCLIKFIWLTTSTWSFSFTLLLCYLILLYSKKKLKEIDRSTNTCMLGFFGAYSVVANTSLIHTFYTVLSLKFNWNHFFFFVFHRSFCSNYNPILKIDFDFAV